MMQQSHFARMQRLCRVDRARQRGNTGEAMLGRIQTGLLACGLGRRGLDKVGESTLHFALLALFTDRTSAVARSELFVLCGSLGFYQVHTLMWRFLHRVQPSLLLECDRREPPLFTVWFVVLVRVETRGTSWGEGKEPDLRRLGLKSPPGLSAPRLFYLAAYMLFLATCMHISLLGS